MQSLQPNEIAREQRCELVQRIVASPEFARSPRQRDFLPFICDQEIEGRREELTEAEVGQAVLGRSAGYSPGEDNIVRVAARQLRQKLGECFAGSGTTEALWVEVPKGGYTPVFSERALPEAVVSLRPSPDADATLSKAREAKPCLLYGLAALSLALCAVVVGLLMERARNHAPENALSEIFFDAKARANVESGTA